MKSGADAQSLGFLVYLFAGISVALLIGMIWVGVQLQQAETLNKVQAEQIETLQKDKEQDKASEIDQHWHEMQRRVKEAGR